MKRLMGIAVVLFFLAACNDDTTNRDVDVENGRENSIIDRNNAINPNPADTNYRDTSMNRQDTSSYNNRQNMN